MMTGIQSVNNHFVAYHAITLLFLFLFAVYDFRHHKIRNIPLSAFLIWCLFSIPITSFTESVTPWQAAFFHSLPGFFCGLLTILAAALFTQGGIGGGDIKFVALLGIIYGSNGLLTILLISCTIILAHYGLLKLSKKNLLFAIPFAPYLFAGCTLYMLPKLHCQTTLYF